jgi:hypothetical protein
VFWNEKREIARAVVVVLTEKRTANNTSGTVTVAPEVVRKCVGFQLLASLGFIMPAVQAADFDSALSRHGEIYLPTMLDLTLLDVVYDDRFVAGMDFEEASRTFEEVTQ